MISSHAGYRYLEDNDDFRSIIIDGQTMGKRGDHDHDLRGEDIAFLIEAHEARRVARGYSPTIHSFTKRLNFSQYESCVNAHNSAFSEPFLVHGKELPPSCYGWGGDNPPELHAYIIEYFRELEAFYSSPPFPLVADRKLLMAPIRTMLGGLTMLDRCGRSLPFAAYGRFITASTGCIIGDYSGEIPDLRNTNKLCTHHAEYWVNPVEVDEGGRGYHAEATAGDITIDVGDEIDSVTPYFHLESNYGRLEAGDDPQVNHNFRDVIKGAAIEPDHGEVVIPFATINALVSQCANEHGYDLSEPIPDRLHGTRLNYWFDLHEIYLVCNISERTMP